MRFMPSCAAHSPVALDAEPHQILLRNPGDCGWIASGLPSGFGNIGRGLGSAKRAPEMALRYVSVLARATSAMVWPSGASYPKYRNPSTTCSGDPRLTPSCSRPLAIRSAAAESSAMYMGFSYLCLLYTSDAADEEDSV